MSEVGDAVNEVRTELATAASEFMSDLCDLGVSVKTDQGAGHTIADSWIASDIPCSHEQIGGGGVQVNDNGTTVTKTDRIVMPYTSTTKLIDRQYKIRVHANGFNPQVIFEQPVQQLSATAPLLEVLAVVTEGYRRPGTL
jgi:hypothetical protein